METAYKACEKRWKRSDIESMLHNPTLLDPRNLKEEQQVKMHNVGSWKWSVEYEERPVLALDDFGNSRRGFCIIPNAMDEMTQLKFAHACLYIAVLCLQ